MLLDDAIIASLKTAQLAIQTMCMINDSIQYHLRSPDNIITGLGRQALGQVAKVECKCSSFISNHVTVDLLLINRCTRILKT